MTSSPYLFRHLVQLPCILLTLLGDVVRFLRFCLHPPASLAAENLFLRNPTVCPFVASRDLLLYQSLPITIPYRYALVRRRKDDPGVGPAARRVSGRRLFRLPNLAKTCLPPVGTEDGRTDPERRRDVLQLVHASGGALAL
jgi:hypothetical protein